MTRAAVAVALAVLAVAVAAFAPGPGPVAPAPADARADAKRAVKRCARAPRRARRCARSLSGRVGAVRMGMRVRALRWTVPAAGGPAVPQPSVAVAEEPDALVPAPVPVAEAAPPVPAAPLPRTLQVVTDDRNGRMRLGLSSPAVAAGEVTVEFNNAYAEDPHDLIVLTAGDAGAIVFGELAPGEVESRDLRLAAGSYRLYCGVGDHAARGMDATLKVEAPPR